MLRGLVVVLCLLLLIAYGEPLQAAEAGIKRVDVTIPVSLDQEARKKIVAAMSALEVTPFVYLNLTIQFKDGEQADRPFTKTRWGKAVGEERGCAFGPQKMGEGIAYELKPIPTYNHLLMTVFTGDYAAFPYLDVSCEYWQSDVTGFRIMGFFHIISNAIPTAMNLQLRPFNPPFEIANKLLAGTKN